MWDGAYKVLKSKVEIDFAFFLILFSLATTGKEFCRTQNFLEPEKKDAFVMKNFCRFYILPFHDCGELTMPSECINSGHYKAHGNSKGKIFRDIFSPKLKPIWVGIL